MKSDSMTLFDTFEVIGDWWLVNSNRKIRGTLLFSPSIMQLSLEGALGENPDRSEMLPYKFSVFGIEKSNGVTWSLLNCFESSLRSSWIKGSGIQAESKIIANMIVEGAHIKSLQNLQVDSACASYFSLETSLNEANSGIRMNEKSTETQSISWTPPTGFNVEIKSLDTVLSTHFYPTISIDKLHATIEHRARLIFTFNQTKDYSQVSPIIFSISNLLTILHGITSPILSVEAFKNTEDGEKNYCIYFRQNSSELAQSPTLHDLNFPLSSFTEDNLNTIVNSWFELTNDTQLSVLWFCSLLKDPVDYQQVEFVNLVQSLESLHRSLHGDTYISDSEYKQAAKILKNSIPQILPNELKDNLKAMICHGHRMSQTSRLKEILSKIPIEIREALVSDIGLFISKVVKTRNYLTHLDKRAERHALSAHELPFANAGLKVIFLTSLYQLLDIPSNLIFERVSNSKHMRIFQTAIPWAKNKQDVL